MTKSQNTKNEQQKDLCITSEQLTEQWKKGELPEGVYYVVYYKNDTPEVDIYRQIFSLHNKPIKNFTILQVTKVLEPVPDYNEYQKLLSDQLAKIEGEEINAELEARLKKTQELELELRKENTKLKELLKDIRYSIAESQLKLTPEGFKLITEIVAKIDEALK